MLSSPARIVTTLSYELRVGVTGHRTIADSAGVIGAIDDVLSRVTALLSDPAAPLALTAVSPLAQGADRLFATAALARGTARLEVVTPLPIAEYRTDFETSDDRHEFEALLQRAARVDELEGPTVFDGPVDGERVDPRDTAYLRVGERVVEACEIVIAIWNGRRAVGTGGTAEIVQHALRQDRLVIWIQADRPQAAPTIIRSVSYDSEAECARVETAPFPAVARELSRGYHQQAAYLRNRLVDEAELDARAREARAELERAAEGAGIPAATLTSVVHTIVPHFVRADRLALIYQHRHLRVVNGILNLAAAAVTVAVVQVLFFPEQLWIIGLEVLAMVCVFGLWAGGRRGAWHEKWLHDRYIAEHLRSAQFAALAGMASHAQGAAGLPFYRGPQHWLAQIVSVLRDEAARTIPPIPVTALRRLIVDAWLTDQQAFHERNTKRKSRQAHRRHQIGLGLFGATLLMALLHMFGIGHTAGEEGLRVLQPGLWITFLALVLPVWAGAIHAVTSQLELERVAERSRRMAEALSWLSERASRASTREELHAVIDDVSALMSAETHEWWVLLSFQNVRLHV